MRSNRRAVLEILASISDAAPVDRASLRVDDGAPAEPALETIAGVAQLHRSFPENVGAASPGEPALEQGGGAIQSETQPVPKPEGLFEWNGLAVLEKIGEGTSADVYRARDPRLDREVALKLYKATAAETLELRERVLHEGRALARIRHEHVAQIHGAATDGGRVGIWMELVHGQTLATVLAERGLFGAREAALVAQDVCRALSAVHHAGLVHGDVKAENIIREDGGRIVLTDFGSGQHLQADTVEIARRTGTPLYLAPEGLLGAPHSVATDTYAVGVLLFHLVTGEFPVNAGSLHELIAAHARRETRQLRDLRPDVPDAFVRVVDRAMAHDATQRFQSAGEMHAALAVIAAEDDDVAALSDGPSRPSRYRRRLVAAAAILVALAAVGAWLAWHGSAPIPRNSVAVLPFRSLGPANDLAYVAEALSDDIAAQISKLPGLRVISGVSARRLALGPEGSARPKVQVAALIEGSVFVSGDVLRVVVQLVDTSTSAQLWGDSFEGRRDAILSLQTRVTHAIAKALRGQLSSADAQILTHAPMTDEAYRLYLKARYFWNKRTEEDLGTSIDLFNRVIALQPDSSLAYAGLADAYLLSALYGGMPAKEAHARAEQAARHAIQLDDSSAEAHAALASAYHEEWRLPEAEREYRRALDQNVNYAAAHHWYALYLVEVGDFEGAQREIEYALALDPLSAAVAAARGVILYHSGNFPGAITQLEQVLLVEPDFGAVHSALADAYAMAGRYDDALRSLETARKLSDPPKHNRGSEAIVRFLSGDRDGAQKTLAAIESSPVSAEGNPADAAAAYAMMGNDERVRVWLLRAIRDGDTSMLYAGVDPRYAQLRQFSGFKAALEAANLAVLLPKQ